MKGPFPEVQFIATGGMRAATARTYLAAGVSVVGLSSDFASDDGAAAVRDLLASVAGTTTAVEGTG
jgi:2-dehydro-3-deoxyphosphogluconate aldolase / (4S)-4-hydroxy-2-oxoglutarate aldolase